MNVAKNIPWWSADHSAQEAEALVDLLRQDGLFGNVAVPALERELAARLELPELLCVANPGLGLMLALEACGVGPGDEVILPALSWIAAAHGVLQLGAEVRLADCLPDHPCVDPEAVQALIGPKTKAILCAHLGGRAAQVAELQRLADAHALPLIEDATQALFSSNEAGFLGTQASFGVFSLGMASPVSSGQGAALVCRDPERMERLRMSRQQGTRKAAQRGESYVSPGFNAELGELAAAVGLVQLERLESTLEALRESHGCYREGLAKAPGVSVPALSMRQGELPLWTEIQCQDRRAVEAKLEALGIQTRRMHRPLSHATHLESPAPYQYPFAEQFSEELLFLPGGPSLPLEHVDRVVEALGVWQIA